MVTGVVKEGWGRLSGVVEKALPSRSTHALDLHLYFPPSADPREGNTESV